MFRTRLFGRVSACSAASVAAVSLLGLLLSVNGAIAQQNAWSLTKTANPTTYAAVGDVIEYTYVITELLGSDGFVHTITDDKVSTVDCPSDQVPANGTLTCTGSYVIQAPISSPAASRTL